MRQGSGKEGEGWKGREYRKVREGTGRRFAARGREGKERDGNKGRGRGALRSKGVERGGEEGKGRRNGELTLTPEP